MNHARTKEDETVIDPVLANQVLWFFGRQEKDGYEPGGFRKKLFSAIASADTENRYKLALGFPGEVAAIVLGKENPNGIEILRLVAEGKALI